MTNEEMKARIESVKSFDDAYKMACEGGYKGTAEEFCALVKNAADEIEPMDMETMDSVAGGGLGDTLANGWDAVCNACGSAVDWVKENPALTAEIAGGVALVGIAIGTSVHAYNKCRNRPQAGNTPVELNTEENLELLEFHDSFDRKESWEFWRRPGEASLFHWPNS